VPGLKRVRCSKLFKKMGGEALHFCSIVVWCCLAESYILHPEVYLIYYSLMLICLGGVSFELSIYTVLLVFTFVSEFHTFSFEAYAAYYVFIGFLVLDKFVENPGSFIDRVVVFFYTLLLALAFALHFYTFEFETYVIYFAVVGLLLIGDLIYYFAVVGLLLIGEVIKNRGDFLGWDPPPDCWRWVGLIFAFALLCYILFVVAFLLVNRRKAIYSAS